MNHPAQSLWLANWRLSLAADRLRLANEQLDAAEREHAIASRHVDEIEQAMRSQETDGPRE
jgi:hypothetical protein